MNVLKNLIFEEKQTSGQAANQNRSAIELATGPATGPESVPPVAESWGRSIRPSVAPSIPSWLEIPPPVLSADEKLAIDPPPPCPRCGSLSLWEAPRHPAGFVWRCRRCDQPRRAETWLEKRERLTRIPWLQPPRTATESPSTETTPPAHPANQIALDNLVAGLDHLKRKYGIGIAEIDGRIRVSDPRGCLSLAIRDWIKTAIHACWPDGRYH